MFVILSFFRRGRWQSITEKVHILIRLFLYVSNSSVTKEYKLWWKGNHFDDINSLGKEGKHQTTALKSIKMSTAGVFSDFQQFLDADHELKEVRIWKTFSLLLSL